MNVNVNVNVNVKVRVRAGVVQEKVLRLVRLIDWIERTVYLCKVRSTRDHHPYP